MPYFFDDHVFDRTNTDMFTGKYQLDWRSYLPKELEFACRHNFMTISDNSIFQQAMLRRKSRHYPITYYNITAKGTERITGHEMNTMVYTQLSRIMGFREGSVIFQNISHPDAPST